jgi:division protein CdvB (Snf7/Vps24/ESCRT-III family)
MKDEGIFQLNQAIQEERETQVRLTEELARLKDISTKLDAIIFLQVQELATIALELLEQQQAS